MNPAHTTIAATPKDISDVCRMARYGHKDWLVWRDKAGTFVAERKTIASMKRCLLDCGLRRNWTLICADTATPLKGFWWLGVNQLAQMKRGWQS